MSADFHFIYLKKKKCRDCGCFFFLLWGIFGEKSLIFAITNIDVQCLSILIDQICSGGNRRYNQNDRGGYNNYQQRNSYQNGYQDRRNDDWGRGNNRGGGAGGAGFREDAGFEPPVRTNDRWPEQDKRDSTQQFGGKWKDDGGANNYQGGGRSIRGGNVLKLSLHCILLYVYAALGIH